MDDDLSPGASFLTVNGSEDFLTETHIKDIEEYVKELINCVQKEDHKGYVQYMSLLHLTMFSGSERFFRVRQCLGEIGLQPCLELLMKNIDKPIAYDDENTSILLRVGILLCIIDRSVPVLKRLLCIRKDLFPIIKKLLLHDCHPARRNGLSLLCHMMLVARPEEMDDAISAGLIDLHLLCNVWDHEDLSVLIAGNMCINMIKMLLVITELGSAHARDHLYHIRVFEWNKAMQKRIKDADKKNPQVPESQETKQLQMLKYLQFALQRSAYFQYFTQMSYEMRLASNKKGDGKVWCSNPSCDKVENAVNGVTFKLCGGCRLTCYCSMECQKFHWRQHHHKKFCYKVET